MNESRKARIAAVIPARLGSTRMPRKVLRPIAGRPMVEWVWRAAKASGLMDPVVVATDAEEVAEACRARGIPVVMTSPNVPAAATACEKQRAQIDADIYVNIQGDEPTLTADFFPPLLELFARPEVQVTTLSVRCPPEEFTNPNAVKVVTALDGRALYFSRATIPFDRDALDSPAIASTWGFMPIARRRWSGLPRCRLRRSKNWSGWSSCGCSKTASRFMLPTRHATRSAWTRKKI
jgi:3-deoxy-manno-octulosonate cytidylyltransferase (CMP-KDO synthetase)